MPPTALDTVNPAHVLSVQRPQTTSTPSSERTSGTQSKENGGESQPKLRQSCDACAAAKVKCNQERPQCERCIASGVTCVYGVSRKYGRQPRRRCRVSTGPPGTPTSTHEAYNPPQQQQQQQQRQSTMMPQSEQLPAADWQYGVDEVMQDFDASMSGSNWASTMDPFDLFPHKLGSGNLGSGSPNKIPFSTVDEALLGLSDSGLPTHGNLLAHPYGSFGTDCSRSSSESTGPGDGVQMSLPFDALSLHHAGAQSAGLDYFDGIHHRPSSNNQHGCTYLAQCTLASIQHTPTSSMRTSTNTSGRSSVSDDFAHAGSINVTTLDSILDKNRKAIANVSQLLSCSCANDPHNAVLYSSIISQILCQYRVAAGTAAGLSIGSGPNGAADEPLHPAPVDPSTTNACREASRATSLVGGNVMIGSFSPDMEDQERMQRVLLLSELRKARQLVERLPVFQRDAGTTEGAAGSIYDTLGSWLKSELSRTTKIVKEGVRAAVITP